MLKFSELATNTELNRRSAYAVGLKDGTEILTRFYLNGEAEPELMAAYMKGFKIGLRNAEYKLTGFMQVEKITK